MLFFVCIIQHIPERIARGCNGISHILVPQTVAEHQLCEWDMEKRTMYGLVRQCMEVHGTWDVLSIYLNEWMNEWALLDQDILSSMVGWACLPNISPKELCGTFVGIHCILLGLFLDFTYKQILPSDAGKFLGKSLSFLIFAFWLY